MSPAAALDLCEPRAARRFRLHPHAGQTRAWESRRRFVAVLAGTQSGKTSFTPWWLAREVARGGAGDYLAVSATFDLMKLRLLPALREVFEHTLKIGRYWSGGRVIEIRDPATGRFLAKRADDPMHARIILRSAESGGGLESATAKGAILDEAGQDAFTLEAWEAILRRLALHRGRALIATTIYNFNWLKAEVYDRWAAGDPDYEVVHFDSTANPGFAPEEFERARATMPTYRFDQQYRGRYTRPAGMVYDCFDEAEHVAPRFAIPDAWPRLLGLDFGGVHTAGVFFAEDPGTKVLYGYREYLHGGRTAGEHARALLAGEPGVPTCVGGSHSEGQWRQEFARGQVLDGERHSLPVREPHVREVEVGIARVYGGIKAGRVKFFPDLAGTLGELRSYSRALDHAGQPTEKIAAKETYHRLDAVRYILGWKLREKVPFRIHTVDMAQAP